MFKNIIVFLKNEKGAALVTVLIVLIVFSILGSVFMFAMITEGKQSVRHSDKTHAYYFARSGAEVAYEVLLNEDVKGNLKSFIEESPTLYGEMGSGGIKIEKGNNYISEQQIIADVTATYKDNGDFDVITIISTGQQDGLTDVVKVELFAPEFGLGRLQEYDGDDIDLPGDEDLESYENIRYTDFSQGASGVINPGAHQINNNSGYYDGPGRSPRLNQGDAELTADALYFYQTFIIQNGHKLQLTAGIMIFNNDFIIYDGRLCLHAPVDKDAIFRFEAGLVYDGEEILDNKTYVIPAGEKVCFPMVDSGSPLSGWPKKWE